MWGRASLLIGVIKISTINCQSSEPLGMSNHVYIRKSLIVSICWCRTRRIMDGLSPELRTRMPWQMDRSVDFWLLFWSWADEWCVVSNLSHPVMTYIFPASLIDVPDTYSAIIITILWPYCHRVEFASDNSSPSELLSASRSYSSRARSGALFLARRRGEKGETATYCPLYSLLTHRLLFSSCRGFIWQ